MFAGPNGSGKSYLQSILPKKLIGVFVNADEIEKALKSAEGLDLAFYQLSWTESEILSRLSSHSFSEQFKSLQVSVCQGVLRIEGEVNSYHASALASIIRDALIEAKISFSFETVMSHASKIEFLEKARGLGYRTYLYFISTNTPEINVSRVAHRVNVEQGHDVPEEKIVTRYHRSLGLLRSALKVVDRGYVFDNSSSAPIWVLESVAGNELVLQGESVPPWVIECLELH